MRYAESRTTTNFPFWTRITSRVDASVGLCWARKCILLLEAALWHQSVTIRSAWKVSWVKSSRITENPPPHPPSFLSTYMTAFLLSLYCLKRVVVKAHRLTIPEGELTFTVTSDGKLDKLDAWWVYSEYTGTVDKGIVAKFSQTPFMTLLCI